MNNAIIKAIIERIAGRAHEHPWAVIGDATHMDVLKAAHAWKAATIITTSHDDGVDISLTIFVRRLRSDIQIICRCTLERNVGTLEAEDQFVKTYRSRLQSIMDRLLRRNG